MIGKKDKALPKEMVENFHMRLPKDLKNSLEAKGLTQGMTLSEIVRVALSEYLRKDVNITNEVLGSLSTLQAEVEGLRRRFELHSNVFIYFLRFFFAFSGEAIEKVPKEMRKQFFEKGEKRRDDFIKLFKQQTANKVNIFELMLGEYLADSVEVGGQGKETDGMEIGD